MRLVADDLHPPAVAACGGRGPDPFLTFLHLDL